MPDGGDLVLIERYDDQAALEHHRTTQHYLNYRAQLSPLLASPISVTALAGVDISTAGWIFIAVGVHIGECIEYAE